MCGDCAGRGVFADDQPGDALHFTFYHLAAYRKGPQVGRIPGIEEAAAHQERCQLDPSGAWLHGFARSCLLSSNPCVRALGSQPPLWANALYPASSSRLNPLLLLFVVTSVVGRLLESDGHNFPSCFCTRKRSVSYWIKGVWKRIICFEHRRFEANGRKMSLERKWRCLWRVR